MRTALWRSARERGVWLADLERAASISNTYAAAYAAAMMVDRCVLRNISRFFCFHRPVHGVTRILGCMSWVWPPLISPAAKLPLGSSAV